MTDAQVADEQFLVLINDMLASGEIPDLFPDDEVENIIVGVRNEVSFKYCCKFIILLLYIDQEGVPRNDTFLKYSCSFVFE